MTRHVRWLMAVLALATVAVVVVAPTAGADHKANHYPPGQCEDAPGNGNGNGNGKGKGKPCDDARATEVDAGDETGGRAVKAKHASSSEKIAGVLPRNGTTIGLLVGIALAAAFAGAAMVVRVRVGLRQT